MKIIKIHKMYSSGSKNHFLVITEMENDENYINELVENWCEDDPAGMNNGYSYDWEYVNDLNVIKEEINNRISRIEKNIKSLNYEKELLENELNILK